jgi:hypothetical protein
VFAACVQSPERRPGMVPTPRRERGTTTSSKKMKSLIHHCNGSCKSFFFGATGAKTHTTF